MSSDDQHFLDVLSSIPNQILHYSLLVTESLEHHFDSAALSLREHLYHAEWLPESIRPVPPPPPPQFFSLPTPEEGLYGYATWLLDWLDRHRALTAATVAFFGTGGYLYYSQRRSYLRKRRARRGLNGMRTEVVVVAGQVDEPLTRSVMLDLERRGFIVYVLVREQREVEVVKAEGRPDLLLLRVDVCDPHNTRDIIAHFNALLTPPTTSTSPSPDSLPHHPTPHHPNTPTLTFTGLVLIPSTTYPTHPIETLTPSAWSASLSTHLTTPIATIQAFLRTLITFNAHLIILTPSITSNLALPFSALETATVHALDGFVNTLRAEMDTLGNNAAKISQIKLGNLDLGRVPHSSGTQQVALAGHRTLLNPGSDEVGTWAPRVRAAYAQNFMLLAQKSGAGGGSGVKGSPMREVHNAVFDALTQRRPREVCRVGRGSLVYEVFGRFAPQRVVAWGLGLRRMDV